MVQRLMLFLAILFSVQIAQAQYDFKIKQNLGCTAIKNQQRTGTCWSFSTVSFIESELMRMGKGNFDLSEMYAVRTIYRDKAINYVMRQGKANFSQGSLNHDVMRTVSMAGVMPENAYSGKLEGEKVHNHSEMEAGLKGFLDGIMKNKRLSDKWLPAFDAIMDSYIGDVPNEFTHDGKTYTPQSFAKELGINPKDYVELASFTHHPFYEQFILEIPDNYSNGSYYNIPIDELEKTVDAALAKGFTVAWDGDVSEDGFSAREGIAIAPVDSKREDLFKTPGKELSVTQEMRQNKFMSYSTTDDHLMHIVGSAVDQNGTKYYLIKNSWGEISDYKGFLYMSEAYFRLKTVGVMLHKNAIPKATSEKLVLGN